MDEIQALHNNMMRLVLRYQPTILHDGNWESDLFHVFLPIGLNQKKVLTLENQLWCKINKIGLWLII